MKYNYWKHVLVIFSLAASFASAQNTGKTFDTDSVYFDRAPILTWKSDHQINGKPSYNGFLLVKAKLNGVYDITGGLQNQETFNVGAIDVWGTDNDPRFWMDLHQTQIRLWSERETKYGAFTGYLEMDAWGSGDNNIRLRYAWFNLKWFRVGQDLSTFGDKNVWPNIMDWDGPPSGIWRRQPQVKVHWETEAKWDFAVAAELSESRITLIPPVDSTLSSGYTNFPDITGAIKKTFTEGNYMRFSIVYRHINFKKNNTRSHVPGYGFAFSGIFKTHKKKQNLFQFQAAGGRGIATYLGSFGSLNYDAINTQFGQVENVTVFGAWATYEYWFTDKWHSNVCVGITDFQSPQVTFWQLDFPPHYRLYNSKINFNYQYVLANIMFDPIPGLSVGVEYNHGFKNEMMTGNLIAPDGTISNEAGQNRIAGRISFGAFFSF